MYVYIQVWMHVYPLQVRIRQKGMHPFFLGCHVGEHQIVLLVV